MQSLPAVLAKREDAIGAEDINVDQFGDLPKGPSIYGVTQTFSIFGPSPPLVTTIVSTIGGHT